MSKNQTLRIATRNSPLALWQARHVQQRLVDAWPGLKVELVAMTTQGDRILDSPLAKIGGKGLFVKELEAGLLEGRADLAVHSMKDVPAQLPEGLSLPVILKREDPRDAFVSEKFSSLSQLPRQARVGTSSLRRQCQVRRQRPDIELRDLRGNVGTRLRKLDAGDYDAIILASAGLKRLALHRRIAGFIEPAELLPAIGQGAIGIETRSGDTQVKRYVSVLRDHATSLCVGAERAFNERLQGGCQAPIAGFALLRHGKLWLRGLVGEPDASRVLCDEISGPPAQAQALGRRLAERMLAQGAGQILQKLYARH